MNVVFAVALQKVGTLSQTVGVWCALINQSQKCLHVLFPFRPFSRATSSAILKEWLWATHGYHLWVSI